MAADADAAKLDGPFDEPRTDLTNAHLVVTDAGENMPDIFKHNDSACDSLAASC